LERDKGEGIRDGILQVASDFLPSEQLNKQQKTSNKQQETSNQAAPGELDEPQISLFEIRDDKIREKIRALDVNILTPMQALTFLADLKAEVVKG
jgi:hypothetical protein